MRPLALLAVLLLASCISNPKVRNPSDLAHGGVVMGLSFKGHEFPYWRRHRASELYFVRLDSSGRLDPQMIPANFRAKDLIYLLDVPA